MCKFLLIDSNNINSAAILRYIPYIERCFYTYRKYFCDDFVNVNNINEFVFAKIPFFWVITKYNGDFAGFVYLDNFVGNDKKLYSAELTTCFDKKVWGDFTLYSAKFFLKKCFDELKLEKIKAQIYPENFRVKNLLKNCGFEFESLLKNETLRGGKLQDIEVYGLYRSYYYK